MGQGHPGELKYMRTKAQTNCKKWPTTSQLTTQIETTDDEINFIKAISKAPADNTTGVRRNTNAREKMIEKQTSYRADT